MATSFFDEHVLNGEYTPYQDAIEKLHAQYSVDFAAIGLVARAYAPLHWVYTSGSTNARFKRIALAPGHGIGGIVIQTGKPMLCHDIDTEIDAREYSSYPIVFAEDLHSFCALPLKRSGSIVGALLVAFRSSRSDADAFYERFISNLSQGFLDFEVVTTEFVTLTPPDIEERNPSELAPIITAQEEERRRISRELHDGAAQELLCASFLVRRLKGHVDKESEPVLDDLEQGISAVLDELHNISVELRPSSLDLLGLGAALKSQAQLFEKMYGVDIRFNDRLEDLRFANAYETQAFRISQEAILNACKYSGSDLIDVALEYENKTLMVHVIDHGVGFDVAHPVIKGSGCGMSSMQERATTIGAHLEVTSSNAGTMVMLVIPVLPLPRKEA